MNELKEILESAQTIAVMGCSSDPGAMSYGISQYLLDAGYRMIPVNPQHREIHGQRCYPDLQSIPEDVHLDIVNIFRNPRFTADMVRQALERTADDAEKPVVWTQPGVSSPEAEKLATAGGCRYIRGRCIFVDHRTLVDPLARPAR